jgi:hypothetical protein
VLSYLRKSGKDTAVVVLNMSAQPQTVALDQSKVGRGKGRRLLSTAAGTPSVDLSKIALEPYGVLIAELAK